MEVKKENLMHSISLPCYFAFKTTIKSVESLELKEE